MDTISASCLSLNKFEDIDSKAENGTLKEPLVSCRSLSKYQSTKLKCLVPQIIGSLIAASFHIGNGISLAYSAILISQLGETGSDIKPTESENSWIASVLIIVVPVASICCGLLMDNFGRLNTIKIAGIPGVLGWIMQALSKNVTMIILGRLLVGTSAAWGTNPGIVYITEIANTNLRMSLMAIAQSYVALGMVLTYFGGWILHWRTVAWISTIFLIVPCILCCFIHESPSWLILKGKHEAAQKSLNWIHKYQPKLTEKTETFAELQYKLLKDEQEKKLEETTIKHNGLKAMVNEFLKPTGYKPLIILIGLCFFQHFSGVYITMFYSISFIKEAKSNINAYLASILIGFVRLIMSVVTIYILKTFRRRTLMFTSTFAMAACMFVAGLYTLWIKEGTTTLKWVPVAALLIYVIASTIGILPIPTMMMAELFPLEIRGIGYSTSYSLGCMFMFGSLQSYFTLNNFFGGATNLQWFFAIVCLGGMVYTYIFLPETFGLRLTDISLYFKKGWVYIGHEKMQRKETEFEEENV